MSATKRWVDAFAREMEEKLDEADMANALAAANKHGFTQVTAWPHGTWIAKSKSGAGHTAQLRETSADALIAADGAGRR